MIAQILPLIRMSLKAPYFSYQVPFKLKNDIERGALVLINFRGTITKGLVVALNKQHKTKFKLKNIIDIVNQKIVTEKQLALMEMMNQEFAVARATLAKSIIPKTKIKQQIIKKEVGDSEIKKNKKELWWYESEQMALEMLAEKIKTKKNKKQILILVPEIEWLKKIVQKLKLENEKVFLCSSRTNKKQVTENYLKLINGEALIVVGTQNVVFLPFTNLKEIFIIQAESWHYKQSDINPRFDARMVSEWLAKNLNADLILLTAAPGLEIYDKFKDKKILKNNQEKKMVIVDLKQEKMAGNFSALSNNAVEKITELVAKKQKILIIHNRKALANYLFCDDCGYVFKCPRCLIALAYLEKNKTIFCRHCQYKTEMPPLCPKCLGPNIKFQTPGVEKIKNDLIKLYPEIKISASDKILGLNNWQDAQILVATEFILNKIDLATFSLIIFSNFDQFLNQADFRAGEKAYQLVANVKARCKNSDIIIQTYEPHNNIIKSLEQNNPALFYLEELANRKLLNYPPASRLIKLICQEKNQTGANLKAEKIINLLHEKIKNKMVEIFGPLVPERAKTKKASMAEIVIKIPLNFDLKKIFKLVTEEIIIDVDLEKIN